VTKPEQAGRANGVHTEVSVCRQGPPPVGGFIFRGNYPSVESPWPSLAGSVVREREAYDIFPGLGQVERVTFSTQGLCPGALPALRRCTDRGVPYRTPTAFCPFKSDLSFDGSSCWSFGARKARLFFFRCPRSGSSFACVLDEVLQPLHPYYRSCFEGPSMDIPSRRR